jgi:hypothetical protein
MKGDSNVPPLVGKPHIRGAGFALSFGKGWAVVAAPASGRLMGPSGIEELPLCVSTVYRASPALFVCAPARPGRRPPRRRISNPMLPKGSRFWPAAPSTKPTRSRPRFNLKPAPSSRKKTARSCRRNAAGSEAGGRRYRMDTRLLELGRRGVYFHLGERFLAHASSQPHLDSGALAGSRWRLAMVSRILAGARHPTSRISSAAAGLD